MCIGGKNAVGGSLLVVESSLVTPIDRIKPTKGARRVAEMPNEILCVLRKTADGV